MFFKNRKKGNIEFCSCRVFYAIKRCLYIEDFDKETPVYAGFEVTAANLLIEPMVGLATQ